MRLFIAINLPSEIKDELYQIQGNFDKKFAKVKWVSKKNLHLTLKFLGQCDENKLEEIREKLKNISFNSFELNLGKIDYFPDKTDMKIIWINLFPKEEFLQLQKTIDSEFLIDCSKDNIFSAHLTLGRIKLIKKKENFLGYFNNFRIKNKSFVVSEFHLIESKLTKDGPQYKVIETFNK